MAAYNLQIILFNDETGEIYHDVKKLVTSEDVLEDCLKKWHHSFFRAFTTRNYPHPRLSISCEPTYLATERNLDFKQGVYEY